MNGGIDSVDGCGNIMEGAWRQDEDGNTGMQSISHTGSNRYNLSHVQFLLLFTGTDIHELLEKQETALSNTFAHVPAKLIGNINVFVKQTSNFLTEFNFTFSIWNITYVIMRLLLVWVMSRCCKRRV